MFSPLHTLSRGKIVFNAFFSFKHGIDYLESAGNKKRAVFISEWDGMLIRQTILAC